MPVTKKGKAKPRCPKCRGVDLSPLYEEFKKQKPRPEEAH